jgi:predicted ATPase
MRGIMITVLALAAAGCATVEETPTVVAAAEPEAKPAKVCWEDQPTGTRFSRTRCLTKEEADIRHQSSQRMADDIARIRHAPLGDPR